MSERGNTKRRHEQASRKVVYAAAVANLSIAAAQWVAAAFTELLNVERNPMDLVEVKGISKRKKKALRGRTVEVLLEGPSEESDLLLEARSEMHAPEIDGKLYIADVPEGLTPVSGEFYRAEITETHDYDLVARIV